MLCSKKSYPTRKLATTAMNLVRARSSKREIPTRTYLCKCGQWHLTKKPDKALTKPKKAYKFSRKNKDKWKQKINL